MGLVLIIQSTQFHVACESRVGVVAPRANTVAVLYTACCRSTVYDSFNHKIQCYDLS